MCVVGVLLYTRLSDSNGLASAFRLCSTFRSVARLDGEFEEYSLMGLCGMDPQIIKRKQQFCIDDKIHSGYILVILTTSNESPANALAPCASRDLLLSHQRGKPPHRFQKLFLKRPLAPSTAMSGKVTHYRSTSIISLISSRIFAESSWHFGGERSSGAFLLHDCVPTFGILQLRLAGL